jgi:hypothetical protein
VICKPLGFHSDNPTKTRGAHFAPRVERRLSNAIG